MIDFAALPPEINSARIYSGPGSAPMLAAAAARTTMAAEIRIAAAAYGSMLAELTSDSWLGPSSMSMAAAAAPYLEWLSATAVQAEHAGTQAHSAIPKRLSGRRSSPRSSWRRCWHSSSFNVDDAGNTLGQTRSAQGPNERLYDGVGPAEPGEANSDST